MTGGNLTLNWEDIATGYLTGGNATLSWNNIDSGYLTGGNLSLNWNNLASGYFTGGNITGYTTISTGYLTGGNISSHGILEPSFETVVYWTYYENDTDCSGGQSSSGVTDGSKSYGLAIEDGVETGYCRVYQTHINLTNINHIYADLYLNSDVSIDVPAYVSLRVNGDVLYERKIGQTETILIRDVSIDVSAYGDYCTLEYRVNQTDVGFYDEGIFVYIDNIRTRIYHNISTGYLTGGNVTLTWTDIATGWLSGGNETLSWNDLNTGYLTGGNSSVFTTIATGYITGGNIVTWTIFDTGYLTGGNATLVWSNLDTGYLTGGNETLSWTNIASGYLTGGAIRTWNDLNTGYLTGGNSSVFTTIATGYLTGGNITTFTTIATGYLTGGNATLAWTNISTGYLTGGNVLSWNTYDTGYITGGNESLLSGSFTYTVTGSTITTTPTITGATHYQWIIENETGTVGETGWIPIADIGDYIYGLPLGGKYRITLFMKSDVWNEYINFSRLIDNVHKSDVGPEPVEIVEEEEVPKYRNLYTDTGIQDWVEDRNLGELALIGIMALIIFLVIYKKRPKKLVIYPIKKKKNQKGYTEKSLLEEQINDLKEDLKDSKVQEGKKTGIEKSLDIARKILKNK